VPSLVAFTLLLVACVSYGADPKPNCESPTTTYDFNVCPDRAFLRAESDLTKYLEAAKAVVAKDAQTLEALISAQDAWKTYSTAHCNSVYSFWRDGTIRNQKHSRCAIATMQQRTHELWAQFLTHVDRSPPVLPEPSP
jgi:uncharacterized protein YecT (DUF1311 family)